MPEVSMRIAQAIAVFDAKVLLLKQGWDLDRVQSLTWVVEEQPAEPGDDGRMTFTARVVDPQASSSDGLTPQTDKASDGNGVTVNPPPMPTDAQQYWTSV